MVILASISVKALITPLTMASTNLLTFLCIGVITFTIAFGSQSCPSLYDIGCFSDPLPCQAPRSVPLQSQLELEDGTVCPGCTYCSESADECPNIPCPLIAIPVGCTRNTLYHLTIPLEGTDTKCWACDYLRCFRDGEDV